MKISHRILSAVMAVIMVVSMAIGVFNAAPPGAERTDTAVSTIFDVLKESKRHVSETPTASPPAAIEPNLYAVHGVTIFEIAPNGLRPEIVMRS